MKPFACDILWAPVQVPLIFLSEEVRRAQEISLMLIKLNQPCALRRPFATTRSLAHQQDSEEKFSYFWLGRSGSGFCVRQPYHVLHVSESCAGIRKDTGD